MYELSQTEHVMMSSDQRSSLWHPTNLLALHESQTCHQHFAIFQEDQLNFKRFTVFPGGISNSSRFPVFPGAVDTLMKHCTVQSQSTDQGHLSMGEGGRLISHNFKNGVVFQWKLGVNYLSKVKWGHILLQSTLFDQNLRPFSIAVMSRNWRSHYDR